MTKTQVLVSLVDMDDPELKEALESFTIMRTIGIMPDDAIKGYIVMAYSLGRLRERQGKSLTVVVSEDSVTTAAEGYAGYGAGRGRAVDDRGIPGAGGARWGVVRNGGLDKCRRIGYNKGAGGIPPSATE